MSECPQCDVVGGPGTDARDRQQRLADGVAVGAPIETDVAVGERAAEGDQGPATRARHRERLGVESRQALGGREDMAQPVVRLG